MSQNTRVVLDTNVVVSGLLFPGSVPAKALLKAQMGIVLASEAIRLELLSVLARKRSAFAATRATISSSKLPYTAAPMQSLPATSIC